MGRKHHFLLCIGKFTGFYMPPNSCVLNRAYELTGGEWDCNCQNPQICPQCFLTVFETNTVSRVYSLIVSTKVGHAGENESGFVQRVKVTAIITFIKAEAPTENHRCPTTGALLETHTSSLRNKTKRETRHCNQQCGRVFLKRLL